MHKVEPAELALQLAAQEAAAAGFAEITTAHLLMALARLSEPDMDDRVDVPSLRAEFEAFGISPRPFRRRMRALVGNGGKVVRPGEMCRSAQCCEAFKTAQALSGLPVELPSLVHLLQAAFLTLAWNFDTKPVPSNPASCPACGERAVGPADDGAGQRGGVGAQSTPDDAIPDEI